MSQYSKTYAVCDICMGKIEDLIESLKRDTYEPM